MKIGEKMPEKLYGGGDDDNGEGFEEENMISDDKRINPLNFYRSRGYIPPLERRSLKRNLDQSVDIEEKISPEKSNAKRFKSSKVKKPKPKAEKVKAKRREALTASKATRYETKPGQNTVALSSVLSKKETKTEPRERKFFKSRSSLTSGNVLLRLENVIPVNMKAVLGMRSPFVSKSKTAVQEGSGTNRAVHTTDLSSAKENIPLPDELDSDVQTIPRSLKQMSKWVKSSFDEEVADSDVPVLETSQVSKEALDSVGKEEELGATAAGDVCSKSTSSVPEPDKDHDDDGCDNKGESDHRLLVLGANQKSASQEQNVYPVFQVCMKSSSDEKNADFSHTSRSSDENKAGTHTKTMLPKGQEQFTIDAGQRMEPVQCTTCNMLYQVGVEHDETLHIKFHEKYMAHLKFQGWKKEHVIGSFYDGRVIMVTMDDPKFMIKKVEDVLHIVDRELGFPDLGLPRKPDVTFLLFIHADKTVGGCLVAESITSAYRIESAKNSSEVIPSLTELPKEEGTKSWCVGSCCTKALCGISRIWVANGYRRQNIATRMVDCLRCHFFYGYAIRLDELAFSDPSPSGREFAAAYTKTNNFLVYK